MAARLWSVGLLFVCGLLGQAQSVTRVTGMITAVTPYAVVLRGSDGVETRVSVSEGTSVLLLEHGETSVANAKAGHLGDLAAGDVAIASGNTTGDGFVARRLVVRKADAPVSPAKSSEPGMSAYQQSIEQQALQKLGGGANAAVEPQGSNVSDAQGATPGNDLERRALAAMQASTAKNEADAQRRREEEEAQAKEAAAIAAATPLPDPPVSTAASIINGISAALGQASVAIQQQNEQQQAQIAQQQQQMQQLAALRQQQAEAAAARLRQQQEAAAVAARQRQQEQATAKGNATVLASNQGPSGTPSTGVSGPPTCVYVGGSRGCVPMAEWRAEQQAAAAATKNPTISSDGTTICPLNGHVTKGHYAACDVWQGQDFSCTPGLTVSIYDGFPNAKGCSVSVSGPGVTSSGGLTAASNGAPANSGGSDTGSSRHTVSPSCTAVDGKWVPNQTYKTKQDLWLVSLCSEDVTVNWFLGKWNPEAGSLHAYETTSATGQGVYPGNSMQLSIYVCPVAYPVPVKASGDKVDGHGQPYSCAKGVAASFLESATK